MSLTQKTSSMATMTQTKDAKWALYFRISMNHCEISIDIHTLFIVMKKHWEIESNDVGEVTKGWCMMEWWNYESRTTKNALGHTSRMNSNFSYLYKGVSPFIIIYKCAYVCNVGAYMVYGRIRNIWNSLNYGPHLRLFKEGTIRKWWFIGL